MTCSRACPACRRTDSTICCRPAGSRHIPKRATRPSARGTATPTRARVAAAGAPPELMSSHLRATPQPTPRVARMPAVIRRTETRIDPRTHIRGKITGRNRRPAYRFCLKPKDLRRTVCRTVKHGLHGWKTEESLGLSRWAGYFHDCHNGSQPREWRTMASIWVRASVVQTPENASFQ